MQTTTIRTAAFALALVVASAALAESSPVVNINTATVEQIAFLPGIGPALAERIATHGVTEKGRHVYASVDELEGIRGIGPKKLAAMRPYVVLTGETTVLSALDALEETLSENSERQDIEATQSCTAAEAELLSTWTQEVRDAVEANRTARYAY